jgi:hypothetical protein
VGPLVLACGVLTMSFMLFAEGYTLASFAISLVIIFGAPLTAACVAATLYRWCFPLGNSLLVVNTAGLLALSAVLSDDFMLTLVAQLTSARAVPLSTSTVIRAVSVIGMLGVLSTSLVMLGVLLVELPIRWFLADSSVGTWEGPLMSVRCIGSALVLIVGWGFIDEFWQARLSELAHIFSS